MEARRRCGNPAYTFAGGPVRLSQYYDHGFDTNFACPAASSPIVPGPVEPLGAAQPQRLARGDVHLAADP